MATSPCRVPSVWALLFRVVHLLLLSAWVGAGGMREPASPRDRLHGAIRSGDLRAVKAILAESPGLVRPARGETTPLHVAAAAGDVAIVRTLIAMGADVNAWDREFEGAQVISLALACGHDPRWELDPSPRHGSVLGAKRGPQPRVKHDPAAQRRALAVTRALIEAGADLGKELGTHWQSMHIAARYGDKALIDLLVEAGVQVEAKRRAREGRGPLVGHGRQPVEVAAEVGNLEAVKALLAHGADPDNHPEDYMGARPALMHAVANGYVDVARALLEAKTDPDLTDDRFGRRPLEIAALAGNRDLCDLLLKHGAADDIYTAIFRGDEKRVAMRIEAEPKFAKHAGGRMGGVLSAAVLARKPRIVKMLIDAGADPNGLPFGGNPLKLAATFDHVECARVLLENGAQLRVRRPRSSWWSRDYCPALYEAADNGSPGVLRLLFKHGVSLARDDYPRNPALRLAAEENRPECVKILIDNGADLKAHGLLAATHALDRWHIAPIRVLLENGLDPAAADRYGRTILHHDFADAELVKLGLKHGMSAKAATLWGETPLHTMARSVQLYYQCTSQDDKACKPFADGAALLIKHGAEMEARSARGWTPLLGAAARGHGGFVRALHRLGAKLDARDAKGRSTLHLACGELTTDELAWGPIYNAKASDRAEERLDTVRYLLREGTPDTDLRAANGCTALHAAVRANLPEVARLLAASGASLTVKDSTGKTPLDGANAKLRAELLAARKKAHRE